MSFLIERMAVQIKTSTVIGQLAQFLPQLWTADHNMLKAAVVSTSIQLVNVRRHFFSSFELILCLVGLSFFSYCLYVY